ncbi:protein MCM10 homolog [Sabethes cyaneus]|uniref:protein MCM10 homolog n=1 Tax=Sabethes cyaneus TaxID=53552 RepID=UPI00237DCA65|nr:protein MCM10 homolog [Sabethes cyaneus]
MSSTETKDEQESLEIDELEQLLLDAESEEKQLCRGEIILSEPSSSKTGVVKRKTLSIAGSTFLKDLTQESNSDGPLSKQSKLSSVVHKGDTDSSDDEDVRNFLARKYDEYGQGINALLKQKEEQKIDFEVSNFVNRAIKKADEDVARIPQKAEPVKKHSLTQDIRPFFGAAKVDNPVQASKNTIPDIFKSSVYTDPVFGIRIVHPLVSSTVLQERMQGRKAVPMVRLKYHIENGNLKEDWALAGVVLSKSPTKTTAKGGQFAIWKLSDLHGEIKVISLFLFSQAYKDLWKTAEGMVICILNPGVLERNDDKNSVATLSIDKSSKVMILGQSKDMGTCRSKKKNGEKCTAFVNLSECEYCVYHVKQEYNKACNRGGLISSTAGRGLNELRNKVLGKNEVFYGGQSFTAVKATKNPKQVQKDKDRLMTLSEYYQSPFQGSSSGGSANPQRNSTSTPSYRQQQQNVPKKRAASGLETNIKQREKDIERLKQLDSGSTAVSTPMNTLQKITPKENPKEASLAPRLVASNGFENRSFSSETKAAPRLSTGNFVIDLGASPKQALHSRQKALEILKKKPLEKSNPNFIKHRGTETGKKRALEQISAIDDSESDNNAKKRKLDEKEQKRKEWIQKIMNTSSSHTDLIQAHEDEQQEKYFKDLERKEAMEEKMMNTFKVACKAVICTRCKYIAFSAADRCKEEQHELRVRDVEKRFFKCADCGNRTVSLHRLPKTSCRNCQSSRWERCAMIRDKKSSQPGAGLSIRGDEEKFLGSCANAANLNLLVPDEGC